MQKRPNLPDLKSQGRLPTEGKSGQARSAADLLVGFSIFVSIEGSERVKGFQVFIFFGFNVAEGVGQRRSDPLKYFRVNK
jgi:hypothetical protein